MQIFHADQFALSLPAGHRFPMEKYRLLRERIVDELALARLRFAPAATDGELALVHTPEYIAAISNGSVSAATMREIGFPWSEAMAQRARHSVGATICACRTAFLEGLSANLAGGTHHAYPDKGSGFCVFNDAAVATRLMQAERARTRHAPLRVAIIDLDVHQGNGTARIFQGDNTVFTLSAHAARNFPFRKERGDLDIELPDRCGDEDYLHALDGALQELDSRFDPGFAIYLAGADPHEGDRLGRLKLSFDGLEARDRRVFEWAAQRTIPMAFAMAGGYGQNLHDTIRVQVNTFRAALEYWQRWQNRVR